ncbi:MAG TPA: SulP family inorganic anion transporter [Bellilinea sp.]|nr:SulP family inorganic anion transporter [Bellilinea sp.]
MQKDLLAGITVIAGALPLALAFSVTFGAIAAAGLVTAIIAGSLIGALSGAPYQISGPTVAPSAAPQISAIPQTLILAERFNLLAFDWSTLPEILALALTITALGAVESLLCGAVASNMTGIRLQPNQELMGQGIGNMVISFFGGVPATAAIARTSIGIKAGGQTRMVSIIHAVGLLLSMFLLAPVMAKIPLSALAGVLIITAWRMNEFAAIRFMVGKRFKSDMLAFSITMLATITLDLTQAILIGSLVAGAVFLNRIANLEVDVSEVDAEKPRAKGIEAEGKRKHVRVAFITGPLFFAATGIFNEVFTNLTDTHALILSMRGAPLVDTAGIEAIHRLNENRRQQRRTLMLAGVHTNARAMLERSGLVHDIGEENIFRSSDQAIVAAEKIGCRFCAQADSV